MEQNVLLVKWFGPFKTPEEAEKWEKMNGACQLYIFGGLKKYAKTRLAYYCGVTKRSVAERFKDANHHIQDIDRISSIYIGRISNVKHPTDNQNKLVEKVLTAYLKSLIGKDALLNETNFSYPQSNTYIINEWWKPYVEEVWQRQSKDAPSCHIPDVLCFHYYSDDDKELFGSQKLKRLF